MVSASRGCLSHLLSNIHAANLGIKCLSSVYYFAIADPFNASTDDTSHVTWPCACCTGIAYDKAKQRIFVTGKKWPVLFEIKSRGANEPDNAALRHVPHTLEHARHKCIR